MARQYDVVPLPGVPLLCDPVPLPMFGQWCEPLGGAWLPDRGAVVVVGAGVVEDVVVPLPDEVVDVDVAAFAIAAPPPAIAAVAATVTSKGLNLRNCHLLSRGPCGTFLARRRTPVGGV
jgi:hypothetical protein